MALKRLRDATGNADAEVVRAFRKILADGRLIATGRRGSPVGEARVLPSAAWPHLRIKGKGYSLLEELTPEKTRFFDVRIFPIVHAPNAVDALVGKSLVEVFRDHLLGDPEVATLAAVAIGAQPEYAAVFRGGRCYPYGTAEWAIDWGHFQSERYNSPSDSDFVFATPEPVEPPEQALADRFWALVELLRRGRIVASGIPSQPNLPSKVPRSVWAHKGYEIDAVSGDLLEWNPEATDPPRDRSIRRWSALMLEEPEVRPAGDQTNKTDARPIVLEAPQRRPAGARSSNDARGECLQWLSEVMRASPDKREYSKQHWKTRALERWRGTLSARGFERVWSRAVEVTGAEAWSKPGAPKLKPNRIQSPR